MSEKQFFGNYVLVWKRGIAVLTAGTVKVTPDPRIQLIDGYNLQIRDVQTHDAGNYICQIGTMVPLEISHTLEILEESAGEGEMMLLVLAKDRRPYFCILLLLLELTI
ncbi:hypothetical protein RUM43_008563 [Polyplax serrata]|uniref:Ig-like domain-containing protein n=1 Tax=Polyplax serrata TaxID=468196 RepID=A0AAN8NMU5_POLSC